MKRITALLALLLLVATAAACGDDDGADGAVDDSAAATTGDTGDGSAATTTTEAAAEDDDGDGAEAGGSESVTVTLDDGQVLPFAIAPDDTFACFVTEDGGSDGGISLDVSDNMMELSGDWAGDSPDSWMFRLDMPDGAQWEANAFNNDDIEVEITGTDALVRVTFLSLFDPGADPVGAEIAVDC